MNIKFHKLFFTLAIGVLISGCSDKKPAIEQVSVEKINSNFAIRNKSTDQIIRATYMCTFQYDKNPNNEWTGSAADAVACADAECSNFKPMMVTKMKTVTYTLEPGEVHQSSCEKIDIRGARFMEDKYIENK